MTRVKNTGSNLRRKKTEFVRHILRGGEMIVVVIVSDDFSAGAFQDFFRFCRLVSPKINSAI